MKKSDKIAVASRSFSKHPLLRSELLEKYEHVRFNDKGEKLSGSGLIEFLSCCDKAIIGLEVLNEDVFKQLPRLKTISKFGVGLDRINLIAMKEHGVKLAYTPGTNKRAVSELVIGLAISSLRQMAQLNQEVRQGIWRQNQGYQLSGKKVGIIGFGSIGKDLATLLNAFSCEVMAYDSVDFSNEAKALNVRPMKLEALLSLADIISLHLPLNATTRYILNAERLALMTPSAILINTARGELVDEQALKELLRTGKISAAAFDVFASEPPEDQELLSLPNFFATPHIGGSTEEAILAMGRAAIDGLDRSLSPCLIEAGA